MRIIDYRDINKGSVKGAFSIELPTGMIIKDCLHFQSGERQWVNLPSKPVMDKEGKPKIGDNGKPMYAKIINFVTKDAYTDFQNAVMHQLSLSSVPVADEKW